MTASDALPQIRSTATSCIAIGRTTLGRRTEQHRFLGLTDRS